MKNKETLPKTWQFENQSSGVFTGINSPTAGARFERALVKGSKPFQLYSMNTPNGAKVSIMLEELLALGVSEAYYDAHLIDIQTGEQFSSGFVEINPNSRIPALIHCKENEQITLFESGSILLYLAEQYGHFIPTGQARHEALSWLFWQVGCAPYVGGGFGHFYSYAPEVMKYPLDRFTMETKRQMDVLNRRLENNRYICGENYSICDISMWPWYGAIMLSEMYDATEFLDCKNYLNLNRWSTEISKREAVKRGWRIFK